MILINSLQLRLSLAPGELREGYYFPVDSRRTRSAIPYYITRAAAIIVSLLDGFFLMLLVTLSPFQLHASLTVRGVFRCKAKVPLVAPVNLTNLG